MMWRSHVQRVASWISTFQYECCCCDQFSAHDQRCTIEENWIFRSSIKYSFQRIKNCQVWRSVQGVVIKSFNTFAKKNSFDTARYEISLGRRSKTGVTPSSRVLCGVNDHLLVREFDELCKGAKVLWMFCSGHRINSTKKRQQRRMTKKGMMMLEKIA